MQILYDKLDSALRDALAAGTGKPVGLSQTPATFVDGTYTPPDVNVGYIVIFISPSPMPEGSFADPEDCRYVDYQIKSVGRSHRQCARIRSMAQAVLTNRAAGAANHGYATSIAVSGLSIIARQTVSNGMIRRSGDDLFESDDIYRLVVTSG